MNYNKEKLSSVDSRTTTKINLFKGISFNLQEVEKWVEIFHPKRESFEVRVIYPNKEKGARSEWNSGFKTLETFLKTMERESYPFHIYGTINPVFNWIPGENGALNDKGVSSINWFFLDIDPVRWENGEIVKHRSATDQEKGEALKRAYQIEEDLDIEGFESPIVIDSGNGIYLAYRVELDNIPENVEVLKRFNQLLRGKYSDSKVEIDQTSNPSHIFKIPGTWSVKGEDSETRPHRQSKFLTIPEKIRATDLNLFKEYLSREDSLPAQPQPKGEREKRSGLESLEYFKSLEAYVKEIEEKEVDVLPEREEYIRAVIAFSSLGEEAEEYLHRVCKYYTKGYDEEAVHNDFVWALRKGESINIETFFYLCESKGIQPFKNATRSKNELPLEVFPPLVQNFVNTAFFELKFNKSFTLSSMLAVTSGAIGNSLAVQRTKGHVETASIYLCLVGDRGTGKSHPLSLALRPLEKKETELSNEYKVLLDIWKSEVAEKKALKKSKKEEVVKLPPKPIRRKVLLGDATTEATALKLSENPRGLLLYSDEFGAWLKGGSNQYKNGRGTDDEFRLSAWNGKSVDVTRITREELRIERPFLSVVGTSQPSIFSELTSDKESNGFLDRILVVWEQNSKVESFSVEDTGMNEDLVKAWNVTIEKILDLPFLGEPKIIPLDSEALSLFVTWQNEEAEKCTRRLSQKIRKTDGDVYTGIMAKMFSYCLRFALILEVLRKSCEGDREELRSLSEVSGQSMEGAIKLSKFFTAQALEVRRISHSSELDKLTDDKRRLYLDLPRKFTTSEGIVKAKLLNIPERTFKEFLTKRQYFNRLTYGEYEKVFD